MKKYIAIIILTKDEPRFLELTVKSILNRTKYPYKLFIVDNNSKQEKQKEILSVISRNKSIEVVYNINNEWLLGFNNAIKIIKKDKTVNPNYTVLTDGDIVVPLQKNNICWLQYLKNKMDNNITIGKIGLSLDISLLKNKVKFEKTYNIEKTYMEGPLIDELVIAPVDTTIAIYRNDLYVTNEFRIVPGHSSLIKPCYYIFRTNKLYQAKHLGWRNYTKPSVGQLEEKIVCFTKYAAYIDPIVLNSVSKKVKYFYKLFRYVYKSYWSIKVIYYWVKYIIKNFPRDLNEIQSKYR